MPNAGSACTRSWGADGVTVHSAIGSRHSALAHGFTIIELLVAAGVIIIMMTLIGQLFTTTTDAVSRGAATADIIGAAEAFASQLRQDGDAMVGPHAYVETGQPTPTEFANQQAEGGILIIVNQELTGRVQPLSGAGEVTRNVRVDQLVFIRTRDPEQFPITSGDPQTFTPHQDNGAARFTRVWYGHPRTAALNTAGTALNPTWQTTAVRLVGGRQELFLADFPLTGTLPGCRANGAYTTAPVAWTGDNPPWSGWLLWHGITDYAYAGLYDTRTTAEHPNGAIVGQATGAGDEYGANRPQRLWSYLSDTDYANRAVTNYSYTTNNQRLLAAEMPLDANMPTWAVNQMHANMITHCSDFVVEFAGDYSPRDGLIDEDTADNDGIQWYSRIADSDRNVVNTLTTSQLPTLVTGTGTNPLSNYTAFVFRHNDDTAWDGSTGSYWPHLIRVRYRLHDVRGQVRSDTDDYGVWFEHVIKVRRP